MSKGHKYALCPPVPRGVQFWEINDLERNEPVVVISAHLPEAESIADAIFRYLQNKFS